MTGPDLKATARAAIAPDVRGAAMAALRKLGLGWYDVAADAVLAAVEPLIREQVADEIEAAAHRRDVEVSAEFGIRVSSRDGDAMRRAAAIARDHKESG